MIFFKKRFILGKINHITALIKYLVKLFEVCIGICNVFCLPIQASVTLN